MKAILKFNISDIDERRDFLRAIKSQDMAMAIWDILQLRKTIERRFENADNTNNDVFGGIDAMSQGISDILEEHDISIDKLIN